MKIMRSLDKFIKSVPPAAVYKVTSSSFEAHDIPRYGKEGISKIVFGDFEALLREKEEEGIYVVVEKRKPTVSTGPPLRVLFHCAFFSDKESVRAYVEGIEYVELSDFIEEGMGQYHVQQFIETVKKREEVRQGCKHTIGVIESAKISDRELPRVFEIGSDREFSLAAKSLGEIPITPLPIGGDAKALLLAPEIEQHKKEICAALMIPNVKEKDNGTEKKD